MNCQEVKELFSDYLDERLTVSQAVAVDGHVKDCLACARELAELRATVSLIGSLGGIETSPDFLARVNEKIDEGRNPGRVWSRLFEPIRIKLPLEAAALLLVSTLAFYLYQRSPELSRDRLAPPDESSLIAKKEPAAAGSAQDKKAPAAKPSSAEEREPPASRVAEVPGAISRAAPTPAVPEAVAGKEMLQEKSEVAAAVGRQEGRATEPSATGKPPATQRARFGVGAQDTAPRAAPAPAVVERQISQAKRAEATKAMSREYAMSIPPPQVLELVTEDVGGSQRRVKFLVEELGGKVVGERASEDGILLALELPESRQRDFQSALKKEPAREISAFWEPPERGSEDLPPAEGALRVGRSTLPEAKKSTQEKDEPTVKLEVRIRRKP